MYKAVNIKYYGNVSGCALITRHATRINVARAVTTYNQALKVYS